jgi:hypothetical protein
MIESEMEEAVKLGHEQQKFTWSSLIHDKTQVKNTRRLALAMLFVYEISFGMSWNSIPWIYAPEITTLEQRHIGAAVEPFSAV